MQDIRKTLAKLSILKEVAEKEDPLVVYTMVEKMPTMHPDLQVLPYTNKEGKAWNAYLLFIDSKSSCCFYKHCLRKGCRTNNDAQLIAEYTQGRECPQSINKSLHLNLNLN